MRFLLDMNLPPAMADWLRTEGHDAVHVLEAGCGGSSDHEIFERASAEDRILVTFDLDFGEIAGQQRGAAVILLRLRSAGQPYLRARLGAALAAPGEPLVAGTIMIVEDARIRVRRPPGSEP
jgi:predicted nuclease of predicted toxin-antitoxin system